jgi:hypothetical protein
VCVVSFMAISIGGGRSVSLQAGCALAGEQHGHAMPRTSL